MYCIYYKSTVHLHHAFTVDALNKRIAMKSKSGRKSPTSIVIPPDLQTYLQKKAAEGYRSMTQEVIMRLEQTRQSDVAQSQGVAQ